MIEKIYSWLSAEFWLVTTGCQQTLPYFFFENGYVGKQPVAWKEYCEEYWLKELGKAWVGDSVETVYQYTE